MKICADGYFNDGAENDCSKCPADYHCEDRKSSTACDTGMYSPEGDSHCFSCPKGYTCDQATGGVTECATGFYSLEKSMTCTQCETGYACSKDGTIFDCTALGGVYGDEAGLSECKPCPSGSYCPSGQATKQECAAGTFSLPSQEACSTCSPGFECPDPSLPLIEMCGLGTYSVGGQQQCTPCPFNHSCTATTSLPCPSHQFAREGDGFCSYFKNA